LAKIRLFHSVTLGLIFLSVPVFSEPEPTPNSLNTTAMIRKIELRAKQAGVKRNRYWREALSAISGLDRANFVPTDQKEQAYEDKPLPIGHGQTISDPFVVALMTSLLHIQKHDRVLEIGTGSGYQAAVLAHLTSEVRTIEIIPALAERASVTLTGLGLDNVSVRSGDGYAGWPDQAPFDAVIVTAGAPYIPEPLLDQLKPGGRMVIPLGKYFWNEELVLVTKDRKGRVRKKKLGPIMFVDFTGKVRQSSPR
jgi:protein-L-isoaspartate(D-aspartate) O-methyltransferase